MYMCVYCWYMSQTHLSPNLKVVDVFSSILPPNSGFLLSQLQKLHLRQSRNPVLVARFGSLTVFLLATSSFSPFSLRLVRCALAQKPVREDLAQTALATYLANHPHCDFLWRMWAQIHLHPFMASYINIHIHTYTHRHNHVHSFELSFFLLRLCWFLHACLGLVRWSNSLVTLGRQDGCTTRLFEYHQAMQTSGKM